MSADDVFDAAVKEAKRLAELKSILDAIKADPAEAAELILNQMKVIKKQELLIKMLTETIETGKRPDVT